MSIAAAPASTSKAMAIGFAVGSVALFALETAAAQRIGPGVPAEQLAFLRSIGGLILVTVIARDDGLHVFRTELLGLQFLRAGLSIIGVLAYFYAFARLPLADATAITYTKAFFLTGIAVLFLGERAGATRWLATMIGAIGALLIIQPLGSGFNPAYLVALLSAFLSAALVALTKVLERRDSARTVMAYVAALSFVAYAGPGIANWVEPQPHDLGWLVAIIAFGPLGQYLGILAIRAADASVLAPFDYLRIVFVTVLSYVMFERLPGLFAVFGTILILGGCLLSAASVSTKKASRAT